MRVLFPSLLCGAACLIAGCYAILPSDGGGQTTFTPPRVLNAADIALPPGFAIALSAQGFTFPSGVLTDEAGMVYVLEAGYAYGEEFTTPRLLRVEADGAHTVIASGDNPPWNGMTLHDGVFFVAEGGDPGAILRITLEGEVTKLVENLPSLGDHHTNKPLVGPDGYLYWVQGTATNSGVVGEDSFNFGWLARHPDFHEIPCEDIVLTGQNFSTPNVIAGTSEVVETGAFLPFGTPSTPGQVIPGALPCTAAILRIPLEGGEMELVAWGFRNPFGLAFDDNGVLYASDNGYDNRGSRPIFGSADFLWRVTPGTWYGFPDFVGGKPVTDPHFGQGGVPQPSFVLAEHPNEPPQPIARLGVHSSSNGMAFSRSAAFGHEGALFIAQFGDMAPGVGKVLNPVGFKVVRVDVDTGVVDDFAVNRGERNAPATKLGHGGLERPVDVAFTHDGAALYIMDFGVMTVTEDRPFPMEGTGVLWRVTRTN